MKKSVNIDDVTRSINEFRIANQTKSFTGSELAEALNKLGISRNVVSFIVKLFPFEKMGITKLYEMPKDPIHKSLVNSCYNKNREYKKNWLKKSNTPKEEISEESALKLLQSKGYQIRKAVGFDLKRFQKENPDLYEKYLVYEKV